MLNERNNEQNVRIWTENEFTDWQDHQKTDDDGQLYQASQQLLKRYVGMAVRIDRPHFEKWPKETAMPQSTFQTRWMKP